MAQKQNWVKSLSIAVNLGTSVAAAIVIGLMGGKWLDQRFDTDPWLTLLGFLFGALTAGKMIWDRLMAGDNNKRLPSTKQPEDKR